MKIYSHKENHNPELAFKEAYAQARKRIENTPDAKIKEQLSQYLEELVQFEFGRYLLVHRGLNGPWTQYSVARIARQRKAKAPLHDDNLSELENFLLYRSPALKATQERYLIFENLLQQEVKESIQMASLPCGTMDDLLRLDFSGIESFKLFGLDLDPASLERAKAQALELNLQEKSEFHQTDAWDTSFTQAFDVLTSNGLNIYVSDSQKRIELYRSFAQSLKNKGVLITSFLNKPPIMDPSSSMDLTKVDMEDFKKYQLVTSGLMGDAHYNNFVNEGTIKNELSRAGFKNIEFFYDSAKIFPTVKCIKA